jgi:hypothetical protein
MEYCEFSGTYEDAREFVYAKNVGRRHLNSGQRAVSLANLMEVDKKRGYGDGSSAEIIRDKARVSETTARRAIELKKAGDTAAIERVQRGETTLTREIEKLKEKVKDDIDTTGESIPPSMHEDKLGEIFQDISGYTVPDNLIEIWRGLPLYLDLHTKIGELLPAVRNLSKHPAGVHMSQEYLRFFKDFHLELDGKQPGHICPHCHGKSVCLCPLCKKRHEARGSTAGSCYCCGGKGYLLKEDAYPEKEWVREFAA